MKKNKHPEYRKVLFIDSSTGHKFLCGSTLKTDQTETFEGTKYPACPVSISSTSHPLFTNKKQFVDTEGRVDQFRKRYATKRNQKEDTEENAGEETEKGTEEVVEKESN